MAKNNDCAPVTGAAQTGIVAFAKDGGVPIARIDTWLQTANAPFDLRSIEIGQSFLCDDVQAPFNAPSLMIKGSSPQFCAAIRGDG